MTVAQFGAGVSFKNRSNTIIFDLPIGFPINNIISLIWVGKVQLICVF